MRYHQPSPLATFSEKFTKNKSTELSQAMDRIARRSFHSTSKNLNRVSEYSLPNSEIKDISKRAFSAVSRQKPSKSMNVINVIKGKPHLVKLGQIKGATGSDALFNDFYTNIYSDRLTTHIKLVQSPKKVSQKILKQESQTSKILSRFRRKSKVVNIENRMNPRESSYIKEMKTIIRGCNNLLNDPLNVRSLESMSYKPNKYN